jgi:acetyltransferase-like isoleucine patch superfamily enzyme
MGERLRLLRHCWAALRGEIRRLDEERRLRERFPTAQFEEGVKVISPHLLQLGRDVLIQRNTLLHCGGLAWSFGGGGITLGDHASISHNCLLWGAGTITFGRNVGLAPGCMIFSSQNRFESTPELRDVAHDFAPVRLEDDTLLFSRVTIGPGVTIGRGSIVAGNSIVLRDVPPMELWGGSPARKLRDIDPDKWRPVTRQGSRPSRPGAA